MSGPLAGAYSGGPTDYKRSFAGDDIEQREVRRLRFHKTPEVMDIEFYETVRVGGIRRHGVRG